MGWFDDFFISKEEQAKARDVDAQLEALNHKNVERGIWTEQQEREATARIQHTSIDKLLSDPDTSPSGGFDSSIKESAASIKAGINSAADSFRETSQFILGSAIGGIFRAIPFWVWLGLAGYLLFMIWPFIPKPKRQ
ncbi:MAG: hypothetical protein HY299_09865 [Verrucomicrobia bacterium]|nr:hypothetical protein [Verrucomicrobiota bacterium]